MLPSWRDLRDRMRVVLAPQRVDLLRLGGWSRRRIVARESLACPATEGGEPWRPAAEALERTLQRPEWRNLALEVALSSHFVRYQLVPWQPELTPVERLAYAQFLFREVYGAVSDNWEIRLSEEPPGTASVASAIDRALLEALRRISGTVNCRLISVQPCFALAFNRLRRTMRGSPVALALAEPGRLCLGLLRDGRWLALRNQGVSEDSSAMLATMLDQAGLSADPPVKQAAVYLGSSDGVALPDTIGPEWTLHPLAPNSPNTRGSWLAWGM